MHTRVMEKLSISVPMARKVKEVNRAKRVMMALEFI